MKKTTLNILLVDDDQYFRLGVRNIISNFGLVTEASSETEAFELLKQNHYDLALIDMQMDSDESGISVLKETIKKNIHSIILSSYDNDDVTERAYEAGCQHFLTKLHYSKNLEPYIVNFVKKYQKNTLEDFFTNEYITQDQNIISQIEKISDMSLKDKSLFISGETGVGKSHIGKLIHNLNYQEDKPFIHLNCSAISENLIEAELFGAKKGSYTGSTEERVGKLKSADGGTLFLDEIATMSIAMQKKLLKALDEKSFYPVGSDKVVTSSFTLITATCENLFEKVTLGEFRKDLFFRIGGINIDIKPLRERKSDIPLLVKYFQKTLERRIVIKEDAIQILSNLEWQGNTRELKKTIELLSTQAKGIIKASDVESLIKVSAQDNKAWLSNSHRDFIQENGLKSFIKRIEKEVIKEVLESNSGKVTHAIKDLKISSSAFYRIFDDLKVMQ
jgi:DNA-binding NtrC family response regulator